MTLDFNSSEVNTPLYDRKAAGQLLAQRLLHHAYSQDMLVLGLPRGGIPVADEIARALSLPLEPFLVRKLGAPHQPELAMGAIASGGVCYLNPQLIQACQVDAAALEAIIQKEQKELARRERLYRLNPLPLEIEGQKIILVDDGIATGASMQAALLALHHLKPQQITVAVPVAPRSSLQQIRREVDEVVCLICPDPFDSVGQWYLNFQQVSDAEVCRLLSQSTQSS